MESCNRQEQVVAVSPVLLLSFLTGAASASIMTWWTLSRGRGGRRAAAGASRTRGDGKDVVFDDDDDDIGRHEDNKNAATAVATDTADASSWRRDYPAAWVEEIKSRIGELPSKAKRMRWPWEKSRKKSDHSNDDDDEDDEQHPVGDENTVPSPPPLSPKDKTGLCIGSIFGLDVGGTLAKLVYFEQRQNEQTSTYSHRETMHHKSASAKLVLHARRMSRRATTTGTTTLSSHNGSTTTTTSSSAPLHTVESEQDLKPLYLVRQESLPDDLSECEELFPTPEFSSQESLEIRWNANNNTTTTIPQSPTKRTQLQPLHVAKSDSSTGMKKSRSMLDISKSRDHAEALDRFYDFARRLDVYETAVKDKALSFYSRELGGDFHFIRFETRRMDNAMHLIRVNDLHRNIKTMGATGGGAHKYAADWEHVLGIQMEKHDELDSLVAGMQFVMSTAIGECYTYRARLYHQESSAGLSAASQTTERATNEKAAATEETAPSWDDDGSECESSSAQTLYQGIEWSWTQKVPRDAATCSSYPYLLVTIGTGVSVLRVDGPRKHERISGSTIGGGTYWGLMRLLCDVESFEDAMHLAERGDPTKVDMMVGDIYGQDSDALEKVGLPADLVASSFGKLVGKRDPAKGVKQEDLARALLLMTTNNIGQVAYLNAKLSRTSRIYFVGNFLRQNQISQHRLSYAIDYWSKGEMQALFLEHEGYFGALGAFLLSDEAKASEGAQIQNGVRHRRSRTMSSVH